jgi:NADPH2 dehydrogenase
VVDAIAETIGAKRTAIRFSSSGSFQNMQDDTAVEAWSHLTSEIQKKHPNSVYIHVIEARGDMFSDSHVNNQDSLEANRQIWTGSFTFSGGFLSATDYISDVAEKTRDLIAFGRPDT